MKKGIPILASLMLAATSPGRAVSLRGGEWSPDGYLRQKAAVMVFGDLGGKPFPDNARSILDRELRSFEAFLWRGTGRKLYLETFRIDTSRQLEASEFLDAGARWGQLPRMSDRMRSELRRAGRGRSDFDVILILYVPPPGHDTPLAGASYLPEGISSIPLRDATFLERGRRHPLHRLLVHEYLHQVEFLLADSIGRPYLLDPDRQSGLDCGGRLDDPLVLALRRTSDCAPIDWTQLSPQRGTWIPR